jgi:hypothetical protein
MAVNYSKIKEYHLLRYDAVYSVEFQPTFRRNISPPSDIKEEISTEVL